MLLLDVGDNDGNLVGLIVGDQLGIEVVGAGDGSVVGAVVGVVV